MKTIPLRFIRFVAFRLVRCLLLLLTSSSVSVDAQIQQAWLARYNDGITNGQHQALKMAIGSDGNIYVCGFSQNVNSNLDYVVLKYAPNGNLLWVARYDSTNAPRAKPADFAIDPGNNSVVTGNAGTVRFNAAGALLWSADYAGLSTASDLKSNVFVTGWGTNFNTVKIAPSGSNLWVATSTDVGPTIGQAVLTDTNGDLYVSGSDVWFSFRTDPVSTNYTSYVQLLAVELSSDGGLLWKSTALQSEATRLQVNDMQLAGTGNLAVLLSLSSVGGYLTCEFSDDGNLNWTAGNPTSNGASKATALAMDSDKSMVLTGQDAHYPPLPSYGTYKLDADGRYLWTNLYPAGSIGTSGATAIATDQQGHCYVTGYSPGATSSNDIVTIAYDTNGKQLWLERYDGPGHGDDEGNAIAVDAQGNVYVAGYDTPVGGGTEMVLIKYSPVTAKHEANGSFQLEAQGAANEPFDVRASTNLADWLDLGTYGADTNGVLLFTDTNAGLFPQRFYVAKPE